MSVSLKTFFQDLQKRGITANVANEEKFYQLKPEEKVVYLGIDCTSENLHIGHLFQIIQTIRFAKEGFTVLLVLGGATSKIGDPSDKLKERPQLKTEELNKYYQAIKKQITRLVVRPPIPEIKKEIDYSPLESFYPDNPQLLDKIYQVLKIKKEDSAEKKWESYLNYIWPLKENNFRILNNDDWLGKLTVIDFSKIGQSISVNYLLSKETIKQRVENPKASLSFLAFSYSLLQAYDFYYLYENYNCHGQLGGSDQWGNLTTGLKLIHGFYPENKTFVLTWNLLVDKDGKKFSKSEGGKKLLLNGEKKDFYDFFRNMPDEQAKIYIKQFTFLEEEQINELIKLNNPPKLRILQWVLYELIHWLNYGEIGEKQLILKMTGKKFI